MRTSKTLFSIFCLIFIFSSSSFAFNYGIVNTQSLLSQSKVFKDLQKKMTKKQQTLDAKYKKEAQGIYLEREELIKQKNSIAPADLQARAKANETKMQEFQKRLQAERAKLVNIQKEAMQSISTQISSIAKSIAKSKKYDLVVDSQVTLYYDTKHDITPEVLKRLNSTMTSVNIK